jgi:hypothetical protein
MSHKDWLIIYDLSQRNESSSLSSVLDLLVAITGSDNGHVYRMDPATCDLRLIGARPALEDGRIPISLKIEPLDEPRVFRPGDPGFGSFPETVVSQVESLLAVPIHAEGKVAGMVTLCRTAGKQYGPGDIEAARKAGVALYELDALRLKLRTVHQENVLLEKRLAERKLMERAKGLLQVQNGWTEEDAYYHLRRTSRQQRTPMAVIAQRVIDVGA